MAARVVAYGTEERLPKGTLVFERGERSVDFFFVLEGNIEIFDFDEDGQPNVLHVHGERHSPASSTCSTIDRSSSPVAPVSTAGWSGSSAPTFVAWCPASRTSARSSCGRSS